MGRRNSGSVSMRVEAKIDVAEFIANVGANEAVEAAVEEDRDSAYEAIDINDYNAWARASGYAPSVDAKMLIDDRESPITALVEVANEALNQRGSGFVDDFVHDSRLDDGIRDRLKIQLWPTAKEYVGHWDDWQNTIGSLIGEATHNHGVRAVLGALRENGRLSSPFRESMRLTTPEALLADTTEKLTSAMGKRPAWVKHDLAESELSEFISEMHEDADKFHGEGHFIRTLLCEGDERVNRIRAEIVKALTPEIERRVKKGLVRKLIEFVFGSDTTVEVVS